MLGTVLQWDGTSTPDRKVSGLNPTDTLGRAFGLNSVGELPLTVGWNENKAQ